MSFNGINHPGVLPQFVRTTSGQTYLLAPPQINGQSPFYYLPQYSIEDPSLTNSPQPPRVVPRPLTLPQPQPVIPQLQQIQANVPSPPPVETPQNQPPPQSKEETNAKVRNIKEKTCLSHFIEGQLILETTYPLTQCKVKTKKKERKRVRVSQLQTQVPQDFQTSSLASNSEQIPPPSPQPAQTKSIPKVEPGQDVLNSSQFDIEDDVRALRRKMTNWSVDEVVKFIENHEDIAQYSAKFADDEVDGKALLLMIDRNLNLQMLASMFKHGPAMKIEAVLSKYKLNTN